ncbi:MAG TPA: molybdenum cofactor guanylyltransferase [Terracidiphilus sp.]|nr:molybdenum cofactor guanylyltransferase [Terracidiphilus sp.]
MRARIPGAGVEPDAEGFVLAGGESRRMGRDKALAALDGRPLVERALEVLRAAGLRARIAGARSELGQYAPVVPDEFPEAGPLGGVCTALKHAEAEWAVFLPVDLPLMAPALIEYLMKDAQITGRGVTLASVNGFAQTFPTVVRRDALEELAGELLAGRLGCFAAFERAGTHVVAAEMAAQAGQAADERGWPAHRWFWNANSPEELARIETLLLTARAARVS